jgi:hypothetical protein
MSAAALSRRRFLNELRFGDPAQGGFSSPVTLRRRRQAHRLDERHQDLIHDLGEQLIRSL